MKTSRIYLRLAVSCIVVIFVCYAVAFGPGIFETVVELREQFMDLNPQAIGVVFTLLFTFLGVSFLYASMIAEGQESKTKLEDEQAAIIKERNKETASLDKPVEDVKIAPTSNPVDLLMVCPVCQDLSRNYPFDSEGYKAILKRWDSVIGEH